MQHDSECIGSFNALETGKELLVLVGAVWSRRTFKCILDRGGVEGFSVVESGILTQMKRPDFLVRR